MDKQLREWAIKDLLTSCRNYKHKLTYGRSLSPLLLDRVWGSEEDDLRLTITIESLVRAEITYWRRKMGIQKPTVTIPLTLEEVVRKDLESGSERLARLSIIIAYYFDKLSVNQLAATYQCASRTMQMKIEQGRDEVTNLVARQEMTKTEESNPSLNGTPD